MDDGRRHAGRRYPHRPRPWPYPEFSEDATATNVIAPNRAALAGLDYMALGDWHGSVAVDARTYYSGAPEPDRFKHDRPGQAMVVSIAGQGAMPTTTAVTTASFLADIAPSSAGIGRRC